MMTNVTPGRTSGATIPHCQRRASPTRTLSQFYLCSSLFCSFCVIQYLWLCRNLIAARSLFPYVTRTICSKLAGQAKAKAPERQRKNTRHKCGMHYLFFCFGKHYLFGKFICSLIPFHLPMTHPGHHAPFFLKFINNFSPSKTSPNMRGNVWIKGKSPEEAFWLRLRGHFSNPCNISEVSKLEKQNQYQHTYGGSAHVYITTHHKNAENNLLPLLTLYLNVTTWMISSVNLFEYLRGEVDFLAEFSPKGQHNVTITHISLDILILTAVLTGEQR